MMKWWSRLCFLVLAVSSLSRGQNETVPPDNEDHNDATDSPHLFAQTSLTPSRDETRPAPPAPPPPPPPPPHNHTSENETDPTPSAFTTRGTIWHKDDYNTKEEVNGSTAAETTTATGVPGSGKEGDDADVTTTVSMATSSEAVEDEGNSSGGYVLLVMIILVIIVLCVILYLLRRATRTYSFDLQRPVPVNNLREHTGTFEPVYLDDLDRPASNDQATADDLSPPPVANGTTPQSEDNGSNGENAPQEEPDVNGLETSLTRNTSPSLGDDPVDTTPGPLDSITLFFDVIGEEEQQNENNNNNPSVCSSDPFVEVNLNDPVWCEQLLTSPDAPSVLPFSPSPPLLSIITDDP